MSTIPLMLDLLALQSQHFGERGIARYVASHAQALLHQPEVVRKLFLHPMSPLPIRLPPALRASSLLSWKTAAEVNSVLNDGPAALYMMSPYDTVEGSLTHCPSADIPIIATLYDLIPLLHPEKYLQRERDHTIYMARTGLLRRADLLLAISESARQDAIIHLGVEPDAVFNIGAGIDARFIPLSPGAVLPEQPFKALGLDGPYMMAVLGDENRKNLTGLIEAVCRLPADVLSELKLVVVGNYADEVIQRYRQTPPAPQLGDRLVFTGRIPDDCLVALYQGALLHVFPSFYEGFGLPVAEAAACGCPSITSNTSSLPEVLNFPEATFNPADPDEMAGLISKTICDTGFRDMLVQRGVEEAAKHTWERVAQRTVDAVTVADNAGRFRHRTRVHSMSKPRIALVGPLPPARSGIADYNERICRELQRYCRLDLFLSHSDSEHPPTLYGCRCYPARALRDLLDPYAYDAVIYTFGNSEHHYDTLDLCGSFPGWVWLHEVRFHGLFCSYANKRLPDGQGAGFMQYRLVRQYGARMPLIDNAADTLNPHFLRERDAGLADDLVRHSRGIILHSSHAEQMLRRDLPPGMAMPPVSVIPLAFPETTPACDRQFSPPWLIGHFGIVDPVKYPELLITAFAQLQQADASLAFVGFVPELVRAELESLAANLGVYDRVRFTGLVSADVYQDWLRRIDLAVQLRAISNGESSAAVNDAVSAGTPVITNIASVDQWPPASISLISTAPTAEELHDAMQQMLESTTLSRQSSAGLALARENSASSVAVRLLEAVGIPISDSINRVAKKAHAGVAKKQALYFLHIPKTAGTSFMSILESQYDVADICPAYLWRDLLRLLPQSMHYSVFRGHFYAYLADHLPRHELRTITFLRDPVDRALSQYRHIIREPGHYFHKRALELGSLAAFMRDPEMGPLLWNAQTRALALDLDPVRMACTLSRDEIDSLKLERQLETFMPSKDAESILLTRAKAKLDSCVSVGISERFSQSIQLIAKHVGWPEFVDSVPQLNTSSDHDKLQLTPEEKAQLREMNRLDEALYAYGMERFKSDAVAAGMLH